MSIPRTETSSTEGWRPPDTRPGWVATGVALVVTIAISTWAWLDLPPEAEIPLQFGADGSVIREVGKLPGLVLGPSFIVLFAIIRAGVVATEPRARNLLLSEKAFLATWIAGVGLLAVVHSVVVLGALGYDLPTVRIGVGAAGVTLLVMGNYVSKTRSTFLFGIRTPWTLADESTWRRTHRVGGRLLLAAGLALALGASLAPLSSLPVLVGVTIGSVVIVTVVYSFMVWKRDARRGANGSARTG